MSTDRKRDTQFGEIPTHTLKKLDDKLAGIMGNIRERGETLQQQTAEKHEKQAMRAGATGLTAAIGGAAVIVGGATLGATLAPAALTAALAVAAASGVKMVYHAAMERAGPGREHFDYRNDMAKNVLNERTNQPSSWAKLKDAISEAVSKHLPGANKQSPEQARIEARAQAYDKLPEKEAVAKFPELASAFSVTKAAEGRLAQMGYPPTSPMTKATMEEFRKQVTEKIKSGALAREPEQNRAPREPAKERSERQREITR